MPELPEVETVRRTLAPVLVGRRVAGVALHRAGIVSGDASPAALLEGGVILALERKGKQLALMARAGARVTKGEASREGDGRVLVVHLGMTGQMMHLRVGERAAQADHIHCVWTLEDPQGAPAGTLIFRDPRRFGGLFPYASRGARDAAWSALGPDALHAPGHDDPALARLWRTTRAIKAALLDQRCLAGVGNIYADEALFAAGIHPARRADRLSEGERARLLACLRETLERALAGGGSTLRDYADGLGRRGSFQMLHAMYGRGGLPCARCGQPLRVIRLAQRTTTFCPMCQPRRGNRAASHRG